MWPFAGSVILIAFTIITLRFLNPETSLMMLLFCYCGICWWASTYRPQTILYVTEIIILFSLPVVLYIMYKAITSKWFDWSSLRISGGLHVYLAFLDGAGSCDVFLHWVYQYGVVQSRI